MVRTNLNLNFVCKSIRPKSFHAEPLILIQLNIINQFYDLFILYTQFKIDYFCKNPLFSMQVDISKIDPKKNIIIKGAQVHNLKCML
jgi:hypothetical protein